MGTHHTKSESVLKGIITPMCLTQKSHSVAALPLVHFDEFSVPVSPEME